MAKAKSLSLLEQARLEPNRARNTWHSALPPSVLKEITDLTLDVRSGNLPGWSVRHLHDWLKNHDDLKAYKIPGKSAFLEWSRTLKGAE